MMHAHRIFGKWAFGKALRQRLAQLVVEARDLLRAEARGDAGTGANPSAPGLVAVWLKNIEAETLDLAETGDRGVARVDGMNSQTAAQRPLWIVLQDQLLRRFDHVAWQRDPVVARDHQEAAGHQYPARLQRGARTIEPMPALTRAHHLEAAVLKRDRFGAGANEPQRQPLGVVETPRLLHQRGR